MDRTANTAWLRCAGAMLLIAATSAASGVSSASIDETLVAGLRTRRLFSLAESHCRQRLAEQSLAKQDQATLTIELIRTFAEHAANEVSQQRAALWRAADQTAESFLQANSDHPQSPLIKVQQALTALARGELARLEAEIAADPTAALTEARETVRQATRLLEAIDGELTQTIPTRRQPNLPADHLTADELISLQHHVRLQLARAFRNQGLSYSEGTPDQLAALTQAVERLAAPLEQLSAAAPLRWQMVLEQAICQRLLKDFSVSEETLRLLDADGVPAELRLAARAELVRIRLVQGRLEEARQTLALGRAVGGIASADFDFANLEFHVAQWQSAGDAKQTDAANRSRDLALQSVQFIEQTHGAYWGRRAEILLVRVGGTRGGGSVELLRRAADDFFLKRQLDDALATYDKAAAAARALGDVRGAFEMAYKAALVEQQRARAREATRRFRELSMTWREQPQAANAHLLAIVNEAQSVKTDPERQADYAELLAEHLRAWPYDATSNSARLWLGEFREGQQAFAMARDAYQAIDPAAPQFLAGVRGAERCVQSLLRVERTNGKPAGSIALPAAQFFESVARDSNGQLRAPCTEAIRYCVLAAARLRLMWLKDHLRETEALLRAALVASPEPPADWQAAAQTLLVVAVASQPGRIGEAQAILAAIQQSASEQTMELIHGLASLLNQSTGNSRIDVARLQLAALDRIPAADPNSPNKELAQLRAVALAAAGQTDEAITLLTRLVEMHPRDGAIQEMLAELLLASEDRARLQRALDQWRIVTSKSLPRSPRWFKAKYSVALAQFKLGDKAGAAKLIRYLQATENLDASGLGPAFRDLLNQCEQ